MTVSAGSTSSSPRLAQQRAASPDYHGLTALMPPAIEFDSLICSDLADASTREWLETNGIGGFASSSILTLNTRRYHGLLIAATKPPVGRVVLLSRIEDALTLGGKRYELSVNQYAGGFHPQGQLLLNSFRLDPFPVFNYQIADLELEKSIFLLQGENTVVIRYELFGDLAGRPVILEVRPLIAFRDYHCTTHANPALRHEVERSNGLAKITPYDGLPSLHFAHSADSLDDSGFWYYNFQYERERERGLDYVEDLYSPFLLRFNLARNAAPAIIASTVPHEAAEARMLEDEEVERREKIAGAAPAKDNFATLLASAADQFIVARGDQKSVIAGYPWFGDWGRDTMISLPGLTLVTGRLEEARNILRAFARAMDQGMLPNRFPEAGETPEYNTVDATLWMFHAVSEFLRYSGDYDFVRGELYPPLANSISWHLRGTRYGIRMDSDGLLQAGEPGVQLTWMDAKVGDWVVTPRHGKPVEIQALWYNALRVMEHLATAFDQAEESRHYASLAERAYASFEPAFWNEAEGCLYDVVTPSGPDRSLRPNQILAVSLPHAVLTGSKALRVLDVVEWELLTPYGLRTLSPRDPNYRGQYGGDPRTRDGAYHQGTVWPWLLGPFLSAYVKVHGASEPVRHRANEFLNPLRAHLWQAGLGQISEVFDGDPPHRPGGCIAQAWSVAEVLRTYIEDIQGHRPEVAGAA
ncbi:MAG TPA: amylo-alpha-1,6-glucosidase [Bryobacteraceae bacterium]|nr:amylo-alpha-1,6-glucosidase [Bryobacteraceae bacterium]